MKSYHDFITVFQMPMESEESIDYIERIFVNRIIGIDEALRVHKIISSKSKSYEIGMA